MKTKLLIKSFLVAVMLCAGTIAWADTVTLLNIDYSSTTTPAWTVVGGSGSIENGAWKHVQGGGGGNRSAYIDFGIASSIDDNWTVEFDAALKPGSDRNDQQITVAGAKTTYTNNTSATGYMYFAVKEETNGGTTYTVKIGNTDVATGVTLSNGTTYHFRVIYDGTTSAVTAYIGDTKYEGTAAIENVGKLRGLHGCVARYNGAITYDNIVVTKEVDEEVVSNPSIDIAYAAANRTVTITSGESSSKNSVTTYYTIDGTDPSASNYAGSFTTASKEITITSNCTLKAISISSSDVASSVSSLAITVGKVSLATPTISASGFTNVDGVYVLNPTFNFTCNNSAIPGTPEATLSYTFTPEGGDESSPVTASSFTPTTKGTLKVIASNNDYLSSEKTLKVSNGYTVSYTGRDYSTATHEDITATTWGSASTVAWAGWASGLTAYLATEVITDDQHLNISNGNTVSLVENWGLVRGDQKTYGYRVRYAKEGDFIALKENTSKGANANATVYQTQYSGSGAGKITDYVTITAPASYAVQQLYHYSPATEVDLAIIDCKKYETSSAFATAVAAESFSTAAEVYAFHTAWQIAQAKASGSKDWTKTILDAGVTSTNKWTNSRVISLATEKHDTAPDDYLIDANNQVMDCYQIVYGLPAGKYTVKAATRANAEVTSGKIYVYSEGQVDENAAGNHVGNTEGDLGHGWSWTSIDFELTATSDVKFGYYVNATGSGKWASCDDWHLTTTGVSATIGSTGWTTFASPYALDLSSITASTGEVKAYYASSVNADKVRMISTDKNDVIAGEGLMFKGTPGAVVTIPVVASGTAVDGNLLVGCTTETNLTNNANYYVLVSNAGTPEFQSLAVNGATIPAGKAYLNAPTAGARLSIVFDDETTGIVNLPTANSKGEGAVYNLNGQRVQKAQKGLYIIDGKKVMVK